MERNRFSFFFKSCCKVLYTLLNSDFTTTSKVLGSKTSHSSCIPATKRLTDLLDSGLTGQLRCGCAAVVGWNWPESPPALLLHPHAPVSAAQTAASPAETQTYSSVEFSWRQNTEDKTAFQPFSGARYPFTDSWILPESFANIKKQSSI